MRNAHIDKMNHRLRQKIKLAVTEQPAIEGKRAKREREREIEGRRDSPLSSSSRSSSLSSRNGMAAGTINSAAGIYYDDDGGGRRARRGNERQASSNIRPYRIGSSEDGWIEQCWDCWRMEYVKSNTPRSLFIRFFGLFLCFILRVGIL